MALTQVKSDGIATGAVTATQIAANAVTVDDIADGSISTAKLAADCVDGTKLADDAVNTEHIADDAVGADQLADTAVTAGSYGSASAIPAITVDAQGRITAASTNAISVESDRIFEGNTSAEAVDTGSDGHFKVVTEGTEALRINNSQRVGIGDTDFDALLSIKGAADLNTTPHLRLKDGTDTREAWIANNAGDLQLANGGNDNTPHCFVKLLDGNQIQLGTANTERFRVGSSGELGIGGATYGTSGQVLTSQGSGSAPQWATPSASNLTRGTEVNSTSGTAIDFTNIPSGVRRITLTFNQVSTNGTLYMMVQLGDSGGFETSGYFSISGQTFSSNGNPHESSIGFTTAWGSVASNRTGSFFLHNPSGNRWIFSGMHCAFDGVNKGVVMTGGVKSLSGVLDRIRITQTGSNTFDNGTIGIFYED